VLFLTSHLPYPPHSGGRRREFELIRALSRYVNIHLVAVTPTIDSDRARLAGIRDCCREIYLFPAPPDFCRKIVLAAGCVPQLVRTSSEGARSKVASLLSAGVRVVHLEGFYVHQLLPTMTSAKIVLTEQNIEFEVLRQIEAVDGESREVSDLCRGVEVDVWNAVDLCVFLTDEDSRLATQSGVRGQVIPNAVSYDERDCGSRRCRGRAIADTMNGSEFVICGNYDYYPTAEGIMRFLREVLPCVVKDRSAARVVIFGNGMEKLKIPGNLSQVVKQSGTVCCLAPIYRKARAVVCPVHIGGGVKMRVIEGLSYGKLTLTTPLGGRCCANPRLMVCQDSRDMVKGMIFAMENPLPPDHGPPSGPTWDQIAQRYMEIYQQLCAAVV
jgi:glycosyltransferase involved in cell wall biosynthesis